MSISSGTPNRGRRITVERLEEEVVQALIDQGLECNEDNIKRLGNPTVQRGELIGYSAEKYGNGEWVSGAGRNRMAKKYRGLAAPGLPGAAAKTENVNVRFSREEREQLEARAAEAGQSVSEYIRAQALPPAPCACGRCDDTASAGSVFAPGHDLKGIQARITERWGGAFGFIQWYDATFPESPEQAA